MGELTWIFGQIDARFRPLIFAVRAWAKTNEITGGKCIHLLLYPLISDTVSAFPS